MAAKTLARRSRAARIAGIQRGCGPEDPRLPALRRDQRVAELEERIRRVVTADPPPTEDQRGLLASLLDYAPQPTVGG